MTDKPDPMETFTIRLPADVIETIRELGLTPRLRQLILSHTEASKMAEQAEQATLMEMAENLVAVGGEIVDFDLQLNAKEAMEEAYSEHDTCRRYPDLNLSVALVTPSNARMRFHGFAKTGAFIYIEESNGYTVPEKSVIYFKKMEQASRAFDNEAWIGDDD